MMKQTLLYITLFFIVVFSSCTGTKNLPHNEKLYTGAGIELESTDKVNKKKLKGIISKVIRPAPNKKFLGMRPKLWRYMVAGENPHTKLGIWLKKKGEAPVLMSSVKPGLTSEIIDARLFNAGIFKSYTESKIAEKKHTASVIYTSHVHNPFTVSNLTYSISNDSINKIVLEGRKKSLIKPGKNYDLVNLTLERARLDVLLKNNGYFYFNPEYLIFKADTSANDRTVALKLTLKDSIPEKAITIIRVNDVFIDQNYRLNDELAGKVKDTTHYADNIFMGKNSEMNIRPGVILRSVYLKKNEIYSRQNHNITLNRLMSLGNFKFVQVKFSDPDSVHPGYMDVRILMTPMPNHNFRAELDLVTKSNNYTGPRMNLSMINRNTFRGAELLNINLAGSFEAQFSGKDRNLYSYSLNPRVSITIPRFIAPLRIKSSSSLYIPKTTFSLSLDFLRRVHYFDMRTFNFTYGFKWKSNLMNEHELNPVSLAYTSLRNQSATFLDLLASNPFLKKSYEEQFIAGIDYTFTFNEQLASQKEFQYFIQTSAETAGNIFSLAKTIGGSKPSSSDPSKVLGSVYSQYAKFSVDLRGYYNIGGKDKLAARIYAGIAKPYGNSSILPYSRQFFSGGPNSIRAFRINSVGPGTTFQDNDNVTFLNLGGDIKFEINGEYRFNIFRFLNGALFADAGNVWLQKSNPSRTGNPFMLSTFLNEMAAGAGIGLRIDVSFFILRFDLATPLRKPWLEENQRWVLNQINLASPTWRKENLVFNIALGYPF